MSFLPIVERELRVASRRRLTFRIRFFAAIGATLLGGLYLVGTQLPEVLVPQGKSLFTVLTYLQFIAALLCGPVLTADCISRERREGTLGFLFLTDLNGLDVVAGKFTALGILPLHAMLAMFPIAAMTVFLGGVTAAEFWRTTAVTLDTLFLSLAAGLWISSVVRDERQAVVITVAVIAMLVVVPEGLARIAELTPVGTSFVWIRLGGPLGLLRAAFESPSGIRPAGFGAGWFYQCGLGCVFLGIATAVIQSTWRNDSAGTSPTTHCRAHPDEPPPPLVGSRARQRDRLRAAGPLAWLAWQGSWVRHAATWVAAFAVVAAVGTFLVNGRVMNPRQAAEQAARVFELGMFGLKLLMVAHAVYFLQGTCRSGLMELILTTPVSGRVLRAGHLAAMREMFLGPVAVLGLVHVGIQIIGRLLAGGDWPSQAVLIATAVVPPLMGVAVHLLDFVAAAHYASIHGLRHDRPSKAVARTVLVILVLPLLLCGSWRAAIFLVLLSTAIPRLRGFRELVQGWYFPESRGGRMFGELRSG